MTKHIYINTENKELHRDLKVIALHEDQTLGQLVETVLLDFVNKRMGRKD